MIKEVMTRDRLETMFVYFYGSFIETGRHGRDATVENIICDSIQSVLNAVDKVSGIESITLNFSTLVNDFIIQKYHDSESNLRDLISKVESELDWYFKIEEQFL